MTYSKTYRTLIVHNIPLLIDEEIQPIPDIINLESTDVGNMLEEEEKLGHNLHPKGTITPFNDKGTLNEETHQNKEENGIQAS